MKINPLVYAELKHNIALSRLMAERRRAEWRTAAPTSTRAASVAKEVRRWTDSLEGWEAVLDLVNAAVPAPVLDVSSLADPPGSQVLNPGVNCLAPPGNAGMTTGELLRTPKSLHYCARPGCGHGDRVHGPFCFAAGCSCADWVWRVRLNPVVCGHLSWNPRDDQEPVTCDDCGQRLTAEERSARMECSFCGHEYHGPDTWEGMDACAQTGCACLAERMARR